MLKNYLTIAFRILFKRKLFSFVNIAGLAVGLASVFLLAEYVAFELSYDRFHKDAERIYRVCHTKYQDGVVQYKKAQSFIPTGEALKNDYQVVEDYTTLFNISEQSEILISYDIGSSESISFSEDRVYHVKGHFFKIFTPSVIAGIAPLADLEPKTVWISSSTARKYFKNASPVNKVIHHSYSGEFRIAGVYDDFPKNSHLKPDFLFSWESLTDDASGGDSNNWHWDGFFTYILLKDGGIKHAVESNFPEFVEKYLGKDRFRSGKSEFWLQPLVDIHLHSDLIGEADTNGDASTVTIFTALSVFILLIAYINYVNLSTARALERNKEIGVRKIVGSSQVQLIGQFLLESALVTATSLIAAAALIALFKEFTVFNTPGTPLILPKQTEFWIVSIAIAAIGCVGAAIYPTIIVSSYKPVNALKVKTGFRHSGSFFFRKGMVTMQFVLTIIMITGSLVVSRQISFMKKHDLGFTVDQTLVLETFAKFGPPGSDSAFMKSLDAFKNNLLLHPKISGVTTSHDIPGKEHLSLFPTFRNVSDEMVSLYYSRIDYDFIPLFNVNIVAGRNFSHDMASDKTAVILNREALAALGFDSPDQAVGHDIRFGRGSNPNKVSVIGVVDFRANSFKDKNAPIVYQVNWAPLRFLSLRLNDLTSLNQTIAEIQHQWKRIFPGQPFNYFFLDEFFNQQYRADETLNATLSLLTGLSITIACLGLYGLSSIVTSQRVKEVGIRKILGASVFKLFFMLSKDFAVLLLAAAVIAAPIVWYSVFKWLEGYAIKAPISAVFYLVPFSAMLGIVLITIGNHTWRIARANPVDSLRDD